MKIVIFNWRDIRNPKSGGAEIVTHEYARGWIKAGNEVTLVCPAFPNSPEKETIDGVKYLRLGMKTSLNYLLIYILVFFYYQRYLKGKIDLVVDQIHGIPFFTPLYVKEKKLAFICEVAGEIWNSMYPKLIANLGKFIENSYFRFYQGIKFLTISESTKDDLVLKGVKKENISVIYPGISVKPLDKLPQKENHPTFIYLNRVCRMKNLKDTIISFGLINKQLAQARLWVIGNIDDRKYLKECKKLLSQLQIENKVTFLGFVDDEKKYQLLSRANILIHTSIKEGWGINVIEANAMGTPSVVYRVSGLSDSVVDNSTGLMTNRNEPSELSNLIIGLLKDKSRYMSMQKKCLEWSHKFSWEKNYNKLNNLIAHL